MVPRLRQLEDKIIRLGQADFKFAKCERCNEMLYFPGKKVKIFRNDLSVFLKASLTYMYLC